MKIGFTGGGSGGHIFPLIAIAERVNDIIARDKIINAQLYFFSDRIYDTNMLFENNLIFKKTLSGQITRISGLIKLFLGCIKAFFMLLKIYPDVVISKGSYVSFPVVLSCRFLGIPVIVHDSDIVAGKVNVWTGKFAKHVALSYKEIAFNYKEEKVLYTGQPMLKIYTQPVNTESAKQIGINEELKTITIVGGSLGAQRLNSAILDILPSLVEKYNVIHVVGIKNLANAKLQSEFILKENPNKDRYKIFDFLDPESLSLIASLTDVFVTRAGSMLFEIANWHVPAVVVPLSTAAADHQRQNAFNYAKAGCAHVVDELNMTPHILLSEIDILATNDQIRDKMIEATKQFSKNDAALQIAQVAVNIALSHESK